MARADEDAVSFEDLRDQTYIAVSRRVAPAIRSAVDAWCQQQGLTLVPSHSGDNIASAISLILTTNGSRHPQRIVANCLAPAQAMKVGMVSAPFSAQYQQSPMHPLAISNCAQRPAARGRTLPVEMHDADSAEHAAHLARRKALAQGIIPPRATSRPSQRRLFPEM